MRTSWLALAGVAVAGLLVAPNTARSFDVVRYEEATIADIQGAFNAKTLKCRALVQMYLERIAAYDKRGRRSTPLSSPTPTRSSWPRRLMRGSCSRDWSARSTACPSS